MAELITGGQLFDHLMQKTNYTEGEARDLIKVLLEALAYMAEEGIVHRDLKPESLLLNSSKLQLPSYTLSYYKTYMCLMYTM